MHLNQNDIALTRKKNFLSISFLIVIAFIIYYPVFYSDYLYTDDWVALWQYKSMPGVHVLVPYGRYITDILSSWLLNTIHATRVNDIIFIRLFSFFGWIISIPIWFFILKRVVTKEKLPLPLAFITTLYLICTPTVSISIGWASCFEMFIANTMGLLSGFILYTSIKYKDGRTDVSFFGIASAILCGVISLFTYQNGFGCFLIPFLIHLLTKPRTFKAIVIGIVIYFLICVVYYLIFSHSLRANHIEATERTKIRVNLLSKTRFFFTRPMASAFHFTYLVNEKSVMGAVASAILFAVWMVIDFWRGRTQSAALRIKTIALTVFILILVYLPSLIVKENYSSNRTLLALDMAVFVLAATTLFGLMNARSVKFAATGLGILFGINAYYNYNHVYLMPVLHEYKQVRTFIQKNYTPSIDSVYFTRPREGFFEKKYAVNRSWDEFGVPSTFFEWVPELFVKQVVYEQTGNRAQADSIIILHSMIKSDTSTSPPPSKNKMIIDTEDIMNSE